MKIIVSSIIDIHHSSPNRIQHILSRLIKKHEVKVVCFNDLWKAKDVDYQTLNRLVDLENINVCYPVSARVSPVLQELLSPYKILLQEINEPYDIHFNYNSLFMGAAVQSKLGRSVPLIYDLADDLAGMIRTSPQIPSLLRPLGGAVGREILKLNLKRAKYVSVTCQELAQLYQIPAHKVLFLPNGVNVDLFRPQESSKKLKKDFCLSGDLLLGYVGVFREWLDWEPVYQAMERFPKIKLMIVGAEGRVEELKAEFAQRGLRERVIFTGMVQYSEVPAYISLFDLALIPFDQKAVSKNALPLKLFEYLSCKCPVASTKLPAVQRIAGESVYYYRNSNDLQNIIAELIINPSSFQERTQRGYQIVRQGYNWDLLVERLEELMIRCCQNKKGAFK